MSFIKICPQFKCFITAPLWFESHCFIIHIVTNEPNGPGSLNPSKFLRRFGWFSFVNSDHPFINATERDLATSDLGGDPPRLSDESLPSAKAAHEHVLMHCFCAC